MRRLLTALALAAVSLLLLDASPRAAPNPAAEAESAAPAADGLELVVFEVEGCVYCSHFRAAILPGYQLSQHARAAPIRFVDLNDPAADRIGLDGAISMVPTAVLLKGNREVGRIPGYTGPESFFQLMKHLIALAS